MTRGKLGLACLFLGRNSGRVATQQGNLIRGQVSEKDLVGLFADIWPEIRRAGKECDTRPAVNRTRAEKADAWMARLFYRRSLLDLVASGMLEVAMNGHLVAQLTAELEKHPEVLEAYLFGSQARGDATSRSDVDVAVYLDLETAPTGGFGPGASVAADLIRALGRDDVDLVILNRAPPLLYHRVLHDGERLLSRDLARTTTREAQAISRYLDFKPALDIIAAAQRRRIDAGTFGK